MKRATALLLRRQRNDAAEQAVTASAVVRVGEVLAVDTGAHTVDVDLAGTTCYAVPYGSSYASPTVGDVVWLLHQSSTLFAICKR